MRELYREFVIAKRKSEEEHNRDMSLAWHTAVLVRRKDIPDLRKLLVRPRIRKQSHTEQWAVLHQFATKTKTRLKRVRLINVKLDG